MPSSTVDLPLERAAAAAGRTLDATTGVGAQGIQIEGAGIAADPSGPNGDFVIRAAANLEPVRVSFSGPGFLTRHTFIRVPGPDAQVGLIPRTFDVASFDQMCRSSGLRRWVTAPSLTIESRTLTFTRLDADQFAARADTMSDDERQSIITDLGWALPQLTGGAFTSFASVEHGAADVGAEVAVLRPNTLTVLRMSGLTAATGLWGYGRYQLDDRGAVTAGLAVLDVDFDRSETPFRRSLRAHELGHALGYSHVTARASVMNNDGRSEPNDFDRAASNLAFQRLPRNRSPDVDPSAASSVNRISRRWGAAMP